MSKIFYYEVKLKEFVYSILFIIFLLSCVLVFPLFFESILIKGLFMGIGYGQMFLGIFGVIRPSWDFPISKVDKGDKKK